MDESEDLFFSHVARRLISLTQAEEITGYAEDYLSWLARRGKLKAVKIGRNWLTTRAAVENYKKANEGPHRHFKHSKRRKKPLNIKS